MPLELLPPSRCNAGCTMTGLAVDILQTLLPKARVLYSRWGWW